MQRTTIQKEADDLDLMVFRTIGALLRFADDHKDKEVREMAVGIGMMRHRVRKHMNTDDRTATGAAI
ncbi:MAG: hypothetical protein E5V63_25490 [Mesorhizobium sp.]|nr:MAG: hypothetical protein E5V63_25490 [Mesorhizobium sp.]